MKLSNWYRAVSLLVTTLLIVLPNTASASEYGYFIGVVKTMWLGDGRRMQLLEKFTYIDPQKIIWDSPENSIIDGASIPRVAWSLIGGPFEGKYRNASVIHDVACDLALRRWEDVHEAFYNAMRAGGVEVMKAKIMYGAVYHFGPRWPAKAVRVVDESEVEHKKLVLASSFVYGGSTSVVVEDDVLVGVGYTGGVIRIKTGMRKITVTAFPPPPTHATKTRFETLKLVIKNREITLNEIRNLTFD